jgi:hypothetical protein
MFKKVESRTATAGGGVARFFSRKILVTDSYTGHKSVNSKRATFVALFAFVRRSYVLSPDKTASRFILF